MKNKNVTEAIAQEEVAAITAVGVYHMQFAFSRSAQAESSTALQQFPLPTTKKELADFQLFYSNAEQVSALLHHSCLAVSIHLQYEADTYHSSY